MPGFVRRNAIWPSIDGPPLTSYWYVEQRDRHREVCTITIQAAHTTAQSARVPISRGVSGLACPAPRRNNSGSSKAKANMRRMSHDPGNEREEHRGPVRWTEDGSDLLETRETAAKISAAVAINSPS